MSPFRAFLRSIRQAMQRRRGVIRLHFHTVVPTALALVGLIFALSTSTSASEVDPASDIQGSLGVSFGDLSTGPGATVFLLNLGCALVFAAISIAVRRAGSRQAKHLTFRAGSKYAR
jgi:hypothetical protein